MKGPVIKWVAVLLLVFIFGCAMYDSEGHKIDWNQKAEVEDMP